MKIPKQPCLKCKKPIAHWGISGGAMMGVRSKRRVRFLFRCRECDLSFEVAATRAQHDAIVRRDLKRHDQSVRMHRLFHAFYKKFRKSKLRKRMRVDDGWKYTGWEFMRRVDALAGKPGWEGLHVHAIDDSYNAGSRIYFLEHRAGNYYWGTTVIVITHCDGQPPHEWFMYGSHLDPIVRTLLKIQAKHRRSMRHRR
jgi:hypothetical protein